MIAFIFADLIILPILVIYRKYYGTRMMLVLLGTFYATMVLAGYLVEFIFGGLGLIPTERTATVAEAGIRWNYTTYPQHRLPRARGRARAAVLPLRAAGPCCAMMGGRPDEHGDHAPRGSGPAEHQPAPGRY